MWDFSQRLRGLVSKGRVEAVQNHLHISISVSVPVRLEHCTVAKNGQIEAFYALFQF